jgi:hypothetical protein
MFLRFINIPVFIISFAIGVFFVYVFVPDARTILVYPTPENVGLLQYKDITGNCFQVKEKLVACPKNEKDISKIPPQS